MTFKVKTGLKVNSTDVINSNGYWIGSTITNDKTTASSSNGASTIIARDAAGAFAAGAITATSVTATSVSAATLTGVAAVATVANTVTLTADDSTNATRYLTFVDAATGNEDIRTDTGLTYNPSTGIITATQFSGSGATLTSIPNSATTASASNGASTIVARDAAGSFTTNGITATSVSAPTLTGVAAVATVANTSTLTADNTTNATNYVPFINAATGNQALRTSLGFSFNPSTNTLTAGVFSGSGASLTSIPNSATTASASNGASTIVARDATGSFTTNGITATSVSAPTLTGVAAVATVSNTATLTADNTTNATNYLTFVNAATGNQALRTDIGLSFNPSTNTLTTSVVNAPTLTGVAAVATVGNTVTLTADDSTNATRYPLFSDAATGNVSPRTDTGFTYNPSTGVLTATAFSGSGASLTSIPNSATTASSANGASTIVARDGAGAFAAGAITATSIAANGAGLTAINASNITLGTLSNSVTTASAANGASTIVARAANGHFGTAGITVDRDLNVGGNAVITGNLTVNGTTTTVNSNEVSIGDSVLVLNSDETGTPSQDAGIEIERGTSTNVKVLWNESTDRWSFTNNGSTYYNIPNSTEYDLYSVSAGTAASGANLTITAATNGTTSNVNFVGTGTVTVTRTNASTITIAGAGSLESETTGITNTAASIVDSFAVATYRTVEYTYHVKTTTGTPYYATGKILIVHDDTNTYQTQYGMLSTNVSDDLATFTSNISAGNVRLLAQGTNANVTVKLVGTNYSTV